MFRKLIIKFIINNFLSFTRFFRIKRFLLIIAGMKIGRNTKIVGPIYFGNKIKITIGENCWIGKNIYFDGDGEISIKDNVDVGPHVIFSTGGHEIGESNHRAGKGIINTISIGEGCWIGTRCTFINNVKIESGCIIGAGSLVNKDSNKNILLVGVPAKEKREL